MFDSGSVVQFRGTGLSVLSLQFVFNSNIIIPTRTSGAIVSAYGNIDIHAKQ